MSRGVSGPLCAENRQKENKRTGEVKYLKISWHNGSVIWSVWKALLSRLCRRGMSKVAVLGYQVNTKIKKWNNTSISTVLTQFVTSTKEVYNAWRKLSVSTATLLNSSWSYGTFWDNCLSYKWHVTNSFLINHFYY